MEEREDSSGRSPEPTNEGNSEMEAVADNTLPKATFDLKEDIDTKDPTEAKTEPQEINETLDTYNTEEDQGCDVDETPGSQDVIENVENQEAVEDENEESLPEAESDGCIEESEEKSCEIVENLTETWVVNIGKTSEGHSVQGEKVTEDIIDNHLEEECEMINDERDAIKEPVIQPDTEGEQNVDEHEPEDLDNKILVEPETNIIQEKTERARHVAVQTEWEEYSNTTNKHSDKVGEQDIVEISGSRVEMEDNPPLCDADKGCIEIGNKGDITPSEDGVQGEIDSAYNLSSGSSPQSRTETPEVSQDGNEIVANLEDDGQNITTNSQGHFETDVCQEDVEIIVSESKSRGQDGNDQVNEEESKGKRELAPRNYSQATHEVESGTSDDVNTEKVDEDEEGNNDNVNTVKVDEKEEGNNDIDKDETGHQSDLQDNKGATEKSEEDVIIKQEKDTQDTYKAQEGERDIVRVQRRVRKLNEGFRAQYLSEIRNAQGMTKRRMVRIKQRLDEPGKDVEKAEEKDDQAKNTSVIETMALQSKDEGANQEVTIRNPKKEEDTPYVPWGGPQLYKGPRPWGSRRVHRGKEDLLGVTRNVQGTAKKVDMLRKTGPSYLIRGEQARTRKTYDDMKSEYLNEIREGKGREKSCAFMKRKYPSRVGEGKGPTKSLLQIIRREYLRDSGDSERAKIGTGRLDRDGGQDDKGHEVKGKGHEVKDKGPEVAVSEKDLKEMENLERKSEVRREGLFSKSQYKGYIIYVFLCLVQRFWLSMRLTY